VRVQDTDTHFTEPDFLACLSLFDLRSTLTRLAEYLLQRQVAGDWDTFPHQRRREITDD